MPELEVKLLEGNAGSGCLFIWVSTSAKDNTAKDTGCQVPKFQVLVIALFLKSHFCPLCLSFFLQKVGITYVVGFLCSANLVCVGKHSMTPKVLCKWEQNVIRAVPSKNKALADFLVEDREAQSTRGWAEAADRRAGEGKRDHPSSLRMTALPFSLPILEGSVLSFLREAVCLACSLVHSFIFLSRVP